MAIKSDPVLNELFCSKIKAWNRCKRHYYYTYVRNLEPNNIHTAFYVGSSFHYGVMKMYQGCSEKEVLEAVKQFQAKYKKTRTMHPDILADMRVYDAIGQGMSIGYYRNYNGIVKDIKVIATEQSFKMHLKGSNFKIPFVGTVDLLYKINNKKSKQGHSGIWLEDHKTAASIREDTVSTLPMNMQMSMYPALVKNVLGLDVSGMVYSIVKKPDIRLKHTETVSQFTTRIVKEYTTYPEKYFYQEFVEYNPGTVKRVMQDVMLTARDILSYTEHLETEKETLDPNNWPRNENACFPYGPKRENRCPFFDFCEHGEKAAGHKLQFFKQREGTERGKIIEQGKISKLKEKILSIAKGELR